MVTEIERFVLTAQPRYEDGKDEWQDEDESIPLSFRYDFPTSTILSFVHLTWSLLLAFDICARAFFTHSAMLISLLLAVVQGLQIVHSASVDLPLPTRQLEWKDVNFLSISDTHGTSSSPNDLKCVLNPRHRLVVGSSTCTLCFKWLIQPYLVDRH